MSLSVLIYFSKCAIGSERGEDNDTFCTFQKSPSFDMAPDEKTCLREHCVHTVPCFNYETGVLCTFVCVG